MTTIEQVRRGAVSIRIYAGASFLDRVERGSADETGTTKALALDACPARSCAGASLGSRKHRDGRRPGALERGRHPERHRLRRVRSGRQSRQTPNDRLHAKALSQHARGAGEAERRSSPRPIAQRAHLWADKFDGELKDVFELQDQITDSKQATISLLSSGTLQTITACLCTPDWIGAGKAAAGGPLGRGVGCIRRWPRLNHLVALTVVVTMHCFLSDGIICPTAFEFVRATDMTDDFDKLQQQYHDATLDERNRLWPDLIRAIREKYPGFLEEVDHKFRNGDYLRAMLEECMKRVFARPYLDGGRKANAQEDAAVVMEVLNRLQQVDPYARELAHELGTRTLFTGLRVGLSPDEVENLRAEARSELGRKGGKTSGPGRQAKRSLWTPHATELAMEAYSRDLDASNETIADAISDNWKLKTPKCPGHRTLTKFVSELRPEILPQRTGSLRK